MSGVPGFAGREPRSAESRPTLLFVSQALPHPPVTGGTQRTFNVLRELEKGFRVFLLSLSRRAHQEGAEERRAAEAALAEDVTRVFPSVPYPSERSAVTRAANHLRSLATGRAYSYYQHGPAAFRWAFADALEDVRPDLLHFDSIDLHPLAESHLDVPKVCTHHDVESLLLQRRGERSAGPLAWYLRYQARRMREVERRYAPTFDLNVTMSAVDRDRLKEIAPGSRVLEVPNAVSLDAFPDPGEVEERPDTVIFVGPTSMFANRDAVAFLLEEIWERVRRARPSARLELVGRNREGERERFARVPGVHPLGQVKELHPHLASAACSLIPIRVGGGTRIKMLESWAMGRAVVTTSLGGEGLAVEDGVNALVRDDPGGFADAVVEVLRDPDQRAALGRAGRMTVERRYSWDSVGRTLRGAYAGLLRDGRDAAGGQEAPRRHRILRRTS